MKKYHVFFIVVLLLMFTCCASMPENTNRMESYVLGDTVDTAIGRAVAEKAMANPGKSGFHLLANGLDAFVARVVLAHHAERSIDVQYYLYHNDLVGRLFTDQLLKAADRGVRVRLLVDDMDLSGRDRGMAVLDSHPNMEVRIFNPFSRKSGRTIQFLTRMGTVTRRMHNKSFTVDNQVTILGGRNIGDEYFEAHPDFAFADLDVMSIGPVVKEASEAFDKYWNSELAYPASILIKEPTTEKEIADLRGQLDDFVTFQADSEYLHALQHSELAEKIRQKKVAYAWGDALVVYDQPEKLLHSFENTEYHLSPLLVPYFEGVQKELFISSPYFVPGKEGTAFLSKLAASGIRVRILTNSLSSNDVAIVHAGYAKYRKDLLRAGVELYEMNKKLTRKQRKEKKGAGGSSKASLHSKAFVFDRERVFIGSLNLDPRAIQHNTEIGIVLTSKEVAQAMMNGVSNNIDRTAFRLELVKNENGSEKILWHGIVGGQAKTFDVDPFTGFWRRFGIGFLSLLPIESQL